jgi:hypothetical protein
VESKVMNDFFKEIKSENHQNSMNISGYSMIPVYVFNPFNLISSSFSRLFQNHQFANTTVVLDCAEIESKTEFFAEIFKGILGRDLWDKMGISYDFSAFLNHFKSSKNNSEIILIFDNSSQINLSHLEDFVRLWERKSKSKSNNLQLPKLQFVFDDSVSFLGMEARLRDRFRVKQLKVPHVKDVFDEFVIECINNELPFLLHPQLMSRFVDLTDTVTFNSLLNQIKFLLISHFNFSSNSSLIFNFNNKNSCLKGLKDIFIFITDLSIKLKAIRQSAPLLSPSKDFYSVVLAGILVDSQAYAEIINELKSLAPNDFVSLFASVKGDTKFNEFINQMISEMKGNSSKGSSSSKIKDFQLDLITSLSNFIRSYEISIPTDYVINDQKGNVRRAFEADPQAALQVALKFPSIYLNCKNCCSSSGREISCLSSSNLNQVLFPLFHNKSTMLDVCLLYRISLEFPSKSINIMSWYKSFSSIVSKSKKQSQSQNEKLLIT